MWGPHNIVETAAACCAKCQAHRKSKPEGGGCTVWVYCGAAAGCATQKFGECWGKTLGDDGKGGVQLPHVRAKDSMGRTNRSARKPP